MAVAEEHLAGFLPLILKWRRPVLTITIAACLLSVVVSLLLPNIYRSTTVFYPTNLPDLETAVNPALIINGEKLTLSTNSDDADRLVSIGQSQPLVKAIIRQFNLTKRYGYSPTDTSDIVRQEVLEQFLYNYNITPNDRSAIEVWFQDPDKYFAARVANAIAQQIDLTNRQLTRQNQQHITETYAQRLRSLELEFAEAQTRLVQARQQYGIFGSSAERESRPESRFLAQRLIQTETDLKQARATLGSLQSYYAGNHPKIVELRATIKGLEAALNSLKSPESGSSINLESYLAGTDEVSRLETVFRSREAAYLQAHQAYADAKLALNSQTSTIYVVQPAQPATKKAKPIRWLIVGGATLLGFIFSVVAVAILERLRVMREEPYYA
jgi:uncharacterized protein involved in exopolysaccharide biosynthesis